MDLKSNSIFSRAAYEKKILYKHEISLIKILTFFMKNVLMYRGFNKTQCKMTYLSIKDVLLHVRNSSAYFCQECVGQGKQ
jgi:hypothetical protein